LRQLRLQAQGDSGGLPRIENRADFISALNTAGSDLILAPHFLPQFGGLSALGIAQEKPPELAIIFVTDSFHEEAVIEFLRTGATDIVLRPCLSRFAAGILGASQEVTEL